MVLAPLCVNPRAPLLDVFFLGGFPLSTITGGLQNQPEDCDMYLLNILTNDSHMATGTGDAPVTTGVTVRHSANHELTGHILGA